MYQPSSAKFPTANVASSNSGKNMTSLRRSNLSGRPYWIGAIVPDFVAYINTNLYKGTLLERTVQHSVIARTELAVMNLHDQVNRLLMIVESLLERVHSNDQSQLDQLS